MNIDKTLVNFTVGPVKISDEILSLGSDPVPYFRTTDFSNLMKENESIMKQLMGAEEKARAVFLTGSGTAAMEASVINVFDHNDKLLVVNGGSFGQRFCQICEIYDIPFTEIKLSFGTPLTENDLKDYEGQGYTGLLVNYHETSTGVLYDLEMIHRFCEQNGLLLLVDSISSFIADEFDMRKLGVDIVLTGSQKALALPPGVSIVVMNERIIERVNHRNPRCLYLNLKIALRDGERGQTPFTPAVGVLIQLNKRLTEIQKIGMEKERAKILAIAQDFRNRIHNYPFRIASLCLSNAMTPVSPMGDISAYAIYETLKNDYHIFVCPNGGDLATKLFRVGHMGNLAIKDNDQLFAAFDDMKKRGIL